MALAIAACILLACAIVILWERYNRLRPLLRALGARCRALAFVADAPAGAEAQNAFAARFAEIDRAMSDEAGDSHALRHGWSQFRESVVNEAAPVLQATALPADYFCEIAEKVRALGWWANIFVAVGLVFTFLGIVAALTKAASALGAGADSGAMNGALLGLLTIAAAKFWTSIAGVASSIVLRFFDRAWRRRVNAMLDDICDRLERGTLHVPPQRIALDQLMELKEQSTALKSWTDKLVVGISDALESRMQPMVNLLGDIRSTIAEVKDGTFGRIGQELNDALSRSAGAEMQALSAAIGGMAASLGTMQDAMAANNAAANAGLEAVTERLAAATASMGAAFDQMNARVDGMVDAMARRTEAAAGQAGQRFEEERARFEGAANEQRSAIDAMLARLAAMGEAADQGARAAAARAAEQAAADRARLVEEAKAGAAALGEAGRANASVLAGAADALAAAAQQAAGAMGGAVEEAMRRSAEAGARTLEAGLAAFGERFERSSSSLVGVLDLTAARLEALAAGLARSAQAAGEHARTMEASGASVAGASGELGRAAAEMKAATAPLTEATRTIRDAVAGTRDATREQGEHARTVVAEYRQIAERLRDTGAAAQSAWADYKARFEGVDQSLAKSLDTIAGAGSDHARALNERVGQIDTALGAAVDRMAQAIDELHETVEEMGRVREAA